MAEAITLQTTVLREAAATLTGLVADSFLDRPRQSGDLTERYQAARFVNHRAVRPSDLGSREPALAAAEEAVALYRTLAADRPDAFAADCARSLWVLGLLLAEGGNAAAARVTLTEAIVRLGPMFAAIPMAFRELMQGLCASYVQLCEAAVLDIDVGLLGPVNAIFERLNAGEENT